MENAHPLTDVDLVDSIVSITEQRNVETLEMVLAETMFSLLQPKEVALFDIHEGTPLVVALIRGTDDIEELPFELTLQHCSTQIQAAFAEYMALPADQRSADALSSPPVIGGCGAFPVITHSKGEGVMLVVPGDFSTADWRVALGLAQIHRNFAQVLNEKDHDRLTGLLNRTLLEDQILRRLTLARRRNEKRLQETDERRRQQPGTEHNWLAMIDIDHFKAINDSYGHIYGDEVLLLISGLMHRHFRRIDQLFRYGGEEFIVLIQGVDQATVYRVLERFRKSVEQFAFPQVGRVTVSLGYVEITDQAQPTGVIGNADQALYHAKENGRNQIAFYNQLLEEGKIPHTRTGSIDLF